MQLHSRSPRLSHTFVLLTLLLFAGFTPTAVHAEPGPPNLDASQPNAAGQRIFLPIIRSWKPGTTTGASYETIPVLPPPTDRPAAQHGDLNLTLRSYSPTSASRGLVDYGGNTDAGAPQMPGIFTNNRTPNFTSAHRVYDWDWNCNCRGSVLTTYPVTLLGMGTQASELLRAPSRGAEIYGGGYIVLVLYAEPTRITLKYTREDNVVWGYTVHIENLTVDTNLLALYQSANAAGRSRLPALRNGQPLGLASGGEVLVAIRDNGTFMDPRSRKDWWQGR